MAAASLLVLLLAALVAAVLSSAPIRLSSRLPVALDLTRAQLKNATTGEYELFPGKRPRTRDSFFLGALGLEPGAPFELDYGKWREVVRCGMFRNLTAKIVAVGAGDEVTLKISGMEMPSITFAPEVTVGASVERPEMSGGVSLVDKNFRGGGERVEVVVSKREGAEEGVGRLLPNLRFLWQGSEVGRDSGLAIGFEENHQFEEGALLVPAFRRSAAASTGRTQTMSSKAYLHLKRSRPAAGQLRLSLGFQPYASLLGSRLWGGDAISAQGSSVLTGVKMTVRAQARSGCSVSGFHDGGVHSLLGLQAPFQQVGFEASAPRHHMRVSRLLSLPLIDDISAVVSDLSVSRWARRTAAAATAAPSEPPVALQTALRARAMAAWGAGCMPLHHEVSLGDAMVVRGSVGAGDRVDAYASVKADTYLLNATGDWRPGFFVDAAAYRRSSGCSSQGTSAGALSSAGLSLSYAGLRLDVAWPVAGSEGQRRSPRFYFGVDGGAAEM